MTISELGSLGELIGSFAVLATLIYLSVQVRLARADSTATVIMSRGVAVRELMMMVAADDSLAEATMKASKSLGGTAFEPLPALLDAGLSPLESFKLQQWHAALLHQYMTQHDAMPARLRHIQDGGITMNFAVGVGRLFWDTDLAARFESMSPEFAAYARALISAHDEPHLETKP